MWTAAIVAVLSTYGVAAMVVTGRVVGVHGGDTLRVMTRGLAADFGEAVLVNTRETSLAGRRAVVNTYITTASTRHVVMIVYPDTNETNVYTFKTALLPGGPTAGPDDPNGEAAQKYLSEKVLGHEVVIAPAEPAAEGAVRGVVRVKEGRRQKNITAAYEQTATFRRAKEAGPAQPPSGYSYQIPADAELLKDKPQVKL